MIEIWRTEQKRPPRRTAFLIEFAVKRSLVSSSSVSWSSGCVGSSSSGSSVRSRSSRFGHSFGSSFSWLFSRLAASGDGESSDGSAGDEQFAKNFGGHMPGPLWML